MFHFLLWLASISFCLTPAYAETPNATLFTAGELAWIAAHPVVHIAVDPDWRPLEYVEHGVHKGLTAEYLEAIAHLTGLNFQLVPGQSWADAQKALITGRIDLLPAVSAQFATPSLSAITTFSEPYFVGSTIIVTTEAEPIIFDARKLNGKTVAIKGGGVYERLLRAQFPEIHLLPLQSPEAALQAVADGRADAAVGVDTAMHPLLRRKYLGTLHISGTIGELPVTVSMGVRKDLPELASIVQKSLNTLTAKQTDDMMDKWLESTDYGAPSWSTLLQYYSTELTFLLITIVLILIFAQRARVARRQAVKSEQAKTRFLAVMSHEIRTPMNAILSSMELLQRSRLDKRQHELADLAGSAAETLLNLLDDVLDLSKLEARKLQLEAMPADIAALVQQAIDMMQIKAHEKQLTIQLLLPAPVEVDVLIDPTRVRQVLLNLLSNAVKFTDRGGVTVTIRLLGDLLASTSGMTLQVTVSDTGIGVSPEQQRRLFQPFSQADSSTTRRYGGTGLGLVICRELIESMGGSLTLQSEVGSGTAISFSIPVTTRQRAAAATPPAISAESVPDAVTGVVRPTILVVDDHPNNRLVIQRQLEELQCDAVLAEDGPTALTLSAARQYPLILLDCYLPGMDGYQVARTIRKREQGGARHQPIIAISAAVDPEHVQRCMESGMDGVLRKPLRLTELKGIIEAWCDVELNSAPRQPSPSSIDSAELFRTSTRQDLADIQRTLHSGDYQLMARYVHRLKGAAMIADMPAIVTASEQIEILLGGLPAVDVAALSRACSALDDSLAHS
ncbi:MAG: transporter substrate-binding domain-containing protein [Collimonas sp.]|uniref:ATP-binding protein n=1 Tax=Collimonas sp. TaxID=1963772 RepID=UPI003265EEB3